MNSLPRYWWWNKTIHGNPGLLNFLKLLQEEMFSYHMLFKNSLLGTSPVAYWAPNDLGSSSFSIPSFCLFIVFMGFSRQEHWSGLPFPSLVDPICQNSPSWPYYNPYTNLLSWQKDAVLFLPIFSLVVLSSPFNKHTLKKCSRHWAKNW